MAKFSLFCSAIFKIILVSYRVALYRCLCNTHKPFSNDQDYNTDKLASIFCTNTQSLVNFSISDLAEYLRRNFFDGNTELRTHLWNPMPPSELGTWCAIHKCTVFQFCSHVVYFCSVQYIFKNNKANIVTSFITTEMLANCEHSFRRSGILSVLIC